MKGWGAAVVPPWSQGHNVIVCKTVQLTIITVTCSAARNQHSIWEQIATRGTFKLWRNFFVSRLWDFFLSFGFGILSATSSIKINQNICWNWMVKSPKHLKGNKQYPNNHRIVFATARNEYYLKLNLENKPKKKKHSETQRIVQNAKGTTWCLNIIFLILFLIQRQ